MSVKGKIYGKYLKRAKYVVKGKKLKSPIATIQKRETEVKPKTEFGNAEKTIYDNVSSSVNKTSLGTVQSNATAVKTPSAQSNATAVKTPSVQSNATAVKTSSVVANSPQMNKKKESDISFSELGKKIVEGEDNPKNAKSDSKTLMFVIVSLAIIIVAGMVKVGSMVYKEMTPKANVASSKEKDNKKNDLSDFLLGDSDDYDEEVIDDIEATVEPTIGPEETDSEIEEEESKDKDEDKDKNSEEILLTDNKDNTNDKTNKREENVNPNNPLESLNQVTSTVKPTKKPTVTPTTQPKPPITAGDDNLTKYVEIGSVSNACDIYHVAKATVYQSEIKSYKYSKAKIEGGRVKVPKSDLYGMWFYDDGAGIQVLRAFENGERTLVITAVLHEKEDGEYVAKRKIYALCGHCIELDDEYSTDKDSESGARSFMMMHNLDLYKI